MQTCRSFPEVLGAARANAPWAFTALYEQFVGPVAAFLRHQGMPDPEDLTSEVFLAAFRALPSFEGDENGFRAFLFTIARRRVVDERRRQSRRVPLVPLPSERVDMPSVDGEEVSLEKVARGEVAALLQRLTPDQRDVLTLRIVADLSVDAVAELLGKPPSAVKALQRRGLEALRRIFVAEQVSL